MRIIFQQFLSFIFTFKKLKNFRASLFLAKYFKNYSFDYSEDFYWEKNQLVFPRYNISLNKKDMSLFHRSLNNIIKTLRNYQLEKDQNDGLFLYLNINDTRLKFRVKIFDSINALNEIYIEKLYYFNSDNDYVVMDIGMNVGAASLYFATDKKVKRVYAYEPFPDTYFIALENFCLNPEASAKIVPRNYGISDSTQDIKIPFAGPGFMGASTTKEFIEEQKKTLDLGDRYVDVHLRSISEELEQIMAENAETKLCLKVDCEGAEFEIIKDLKSKGLLKHISLIILEWHFRDKFIIIKDLEESGYLVFSQDRDAGSPMGMIYAVNKHNMI